MEEIDPKSIAKLWESAQYETAAAVSTVAAAFDAALTDYGNNHASNAGEYRGLRMLAARRLQELHSISESWEVAEALYDGWTKAQVAELFGYAQPNRFQRLWPYADVILAARKAAERTQTTQSLSLLPGVALQISPRSRATWDDTTA